MNFSEHAPMLASHITLLTVFVAIVWIGLIWVLRHWRQIAGVEAGVVLIGGFLAVSVLTWEGAYYGLARYFDVMGGPNLWHAPFIYFGSVQRWVAIVAAVIFFSGLRRLLLQHDREYERFVMLASLLGAAAVWTLAFCLLR